MESNQRESNQSADATTKSDDDNRREFPRISVRLTIDLQADAEVHQCETSNISWGGLAILELVGPVSIGDDVELGLSAEAPLVSAHVCWRRGDEIGVRFTPRGRVERQCVRDWVQEALKTCS